MSTKSDFDPLERFAGIERLAGKVYFKLSDLFLGQGELRNFWWQMAMDEEQHASVLIACKTLMDEASQQPLDPSVNAEAAHRLETKLRSYLNTPGRDISVEGAFEIALEMESSELDLIYAKLLESCGPRVAKTMAKFGVTGGEQRAKLKAAILRFCTEPKLRTAAQELE